MLQSRRDRRAEKVTQDARLRKILRNSVAEYRAPSTEEARRVQIREGWSSIGIPNQFAAMLWGATPAAGSVPTKPS